MTSWAMTERVFAHARMDWAHVLILGTWYARVRPLGSIEWAMRRCFCVYAVSRHTVLQEDWQKSDQRDWRYACHCTSHRSRFDCQL